MDFNRKIGSKASMTDTKASGAGIRYRAVRIMIALWLVSVVLALTAAYGAVDCFAKGYTYKAVDGLAKGYTYKVVDGLAADYTDKTVILHSHDVHGAIGRYQYIAGLRDELEERGADVYIVDSGDYLQGSSEVSYSKGASAIRMMNAVKYDLATLGNHEFDYGYSRLKELLGRAEFSVICDSITDESGDFVFQKTKMLGKDVNVGFVGITTPETYTKTGPSNMEGLRLLTNETSPAIFEQAASDIKELREQGADVTLCLTHLGVDESSAPYRSYDLWNKVRDNPAARPDMILDGHSHTVMETGENGEPIIQTGTQFNNISVITIDEKTKSIDQKIRPMLYNVTESSYCNEDVRKLADEVNAEVDKEYGKVIGSSEVILNGTNEGKSIAEDGTVFANGNRDGETNLGDFVSDAVRWYALRYRKDKSTPDDHVIGLINGGGMRAGLGKGTVKRRDFLNIFPYGNSIVGLYVTGSQLLELLEASTYCTPESLGGFPHVSGAEYTVDTGKAYVPKDEPYAYSSFFGPREIRRVTINSVNGKPFSRKDTYLLCTNSFIADAGETCGALAGAKRISIADVDEEVLGAYLVEGLGGVIGKKYKEPAGRIKIGTGDAIKRDGTMKASLRKKTIKIRYRKIRKRKIVLKSGRVFKVRNAQGKVTFKKLAVKRKKYSGYFKLSRTGKLTIKKGLKKGTYIIRVKVRDSGNAAYRAASTTLKLKIRTH